MPVSVYAQKRQRLCAEALAFMRKWAYLYLIVFLTVTVYAQGRQRLCAEKNKYLYDFLMKCEKDIFFDRFMAKIFFYKLAMAKYYG